MAKKRNLFGIEVESHENEFYPTPSSATQSLLKVVKFPGLVWEPSCGDGAISKLLYAEGYDVRSTDKFNWGYGAPGIDFLESDLTADHIVTNPPYDIINEYIDHALTQATKSVCLLVRLNMLGGQARMLRLRGYRVRYYQLLHRPKFVMRGKIRGMLDYGWLHWDLTSSEDLMTFHWLD